jgi:5-methylcytosine-specific restriction endonuclease McrA
MKEDPFELLRPRDRLLVMDLVSEAGLDVSDWQNYKGKHPASNPKYCYEWVFPGEDRIAACLWFANLEVAATGRTVQKLNLWTIIKRHEATGGRPTVARRARTLDEALQRAYRLQLPVRVIVVDGEQADLERDDDQSSIVRTRRLDPEAWFVAEYDWSSGQCLLVRGPGGPKYVDQFSAEVVSDPQRILRQGVVYGRSDTIRNLVLERAAGCCEYCGAKGFETAAGGIYLETHHVIPLCEDGADSTGNVVALCPEHHRQAHYGKDRNQIREALLNRLGAAEAA